MTPRTVIVVGVSTGGPDALAELVPALPADLPAPVLIVQHMPPMFTRLLAERLDRASALRVREAEHGMRLEAGLVLVAPGGRHLAIEPTADGPRVQLHAGPPENSCRPAADVLFRSAAAVFGAGTTAVVLTGMGQDGLRGAEAVREAGGRVLVQDEATSVVWGMPGYVARAGLADRIVPLAELPLEIVRAAATRRVARRAARREA